MTPTEGQTTTMKPRPRKQLLRKLGVFLLLGAIVNVAVAWILGAFAPLENTSESLRTDYERGGSNASWWENSYPFGDFVPPNEPQHDSATDEVRYQEPRNIMQRVVMFGMEVLWADRASVESDERGVSVMRARTGLPFLAMQAERWIKTVSLDGVETRTELVRGIRWNPPATSQIQDQLSFMMGGRYMPMRPLWPGFAINTIFYAAMLWMLRIAPGKIRRFIRVKRHRCPACAYPVGTSPVCTECGHPLSKPSSSP